MEPTPRVPITVTAQEVDAPVDVQAFARQLVATVLAVDAAPTVLPLQRAS